MKKLADRHKREVEFLVGDLVLIKLQPYQQGSMAHRQSHKLAKEYYEPYRISQRVGPMAYKLDLPSYAKVHNVFHVSILKHYHGTTQLPTLSLPPEFVDGLPFLLPAAILQQRHEARDGQ